MKEKIKDNINNPEKLEQLYRDDRKAFESGFLEVFPEINETELAKYWKIRLDSDREHAGAKKTDLADLLIMISACFIAGFLIKIHDTFNLKMPEFFFYLKNAGLIVFLGLTIYVAWLNRITDLKKLIPVFLAFIIPAIYINLLPSVKESDSVQLACLHLPLLMWCIFGLVYIDFNLTDLTRRIEYIRYNGDLAIMAALIIVSGILLTGITIALFNAIGIDIENFYINNVVLVGLVCVPVVATYILINYAAMTRKIAPIIASIFSPLVLITAVIYLIFLAFSGRDPYRDRDFLLIFNVMLLGVMAIIIFSISGTSVNRKQKFNEMILLVLSILTVIIDLIALSAIFYRLGTYGITPNRLAVLGSNLLIMVNLVLIIIDLYKINFKNSLIEKVELTVAKYLPVYAIWILFVVFGFPLIFGMK